jgi:hypothetical protein
MRFRRIDEAQKKSQPKVVFVALVGIIGAGA